MNISNVQWLEQLNGDIEYWRYMARAAEREMEQAQANIKSLSEDRERLLKRIQVGTPTAQALADAINKSINADVVHVVVGDNGEERVIAKGYHK
jgi:predicted  nucleic acid-binding Zn-ribbon protein